MSDSEPSFGLPKNWDKIPEEERKLLQKPLIFPNSEKLFRRFTVGATLGKNIFIFYEKICSNIEQGGGFPTEIKLPSPQLKGYKCANTWICPFTSKMCGVRQ